MSIIGIVAVDRNLAIGKDGAIPWHFSEDMRFFKRTTLGNACVMGYRTWKSMKKALPGRLNIVLSRTRVIEPAQGVISFHDTQSVLALYPYLKCDLFVIGGLQVYTAFSGQIDKWIVTRARV